MGLYYPVILKSDEVIDTERENPYRSKYLLLKALSLGQMSADKEPLIPVLEQVISEYPGTPEELKAKEMLDIIKNGYSADIESNFAKNNLYQYVEGSELFMVIFPAEKEEKNISLTKSNVADFNKEFFGKNKLITDAKLFNDKSVIVVRTFTEKEAQLYVKQFKRTKKYLGDMQNAKIIYISKDNLKTLFETYKLEEYESFFLEFY
jgi:hypothetical protein